MRPNRLNVLLRITTPVPYCDDGEGGGGWNSLRFHGLLGDPFPEEERERLYGMVYILARRLPLLARTLQASPPSFPPPPDLPPPSQPRPLTIPPHDSYPSLGCTGLFHLQPRTGLLQYVSALSFLFPAPSLADASFSPAVTSTSGNLGCLTVIDEARVV